MIRTIADLLDELRAKELAVLRKHGFIDHPGLIGDMYEGLTKEILRRAIFEQLSLRIVDGKIRNSAGELSGQIDCMLVIGNGEQIPYTTSFIYPIGQVLAVFEVKKNLYSRDLIDAYKNLQTVACLARKATDESFRHCDAAFRLIAGRELLADEWPRLHHHIKMIAYALALDVERPIRIIMGYYGFSSEESLREALLDFLEAELKHAAKSEARDLGVGPPRAVRGFGPSDFPNLILCKEHSIVKLNGMPYGASLVKKPVNAPENNLGDWWPLLGSLSKNPSLPLLEVLWTRLRLKYTVSPNVFGEDLTFEYPNPLLFAKGRQGGWEYAEASSQLQGTEIEWRPAVLDLNQTAALDYLGGKEEVCVDDDRTFSEIVEQAGSTVDEFVEKLVNTGLVYVDTQRRLRFLTHELTVVFSPDGSVVAGDNQSGRLTRWIKKRYD